MVVYPQNFPQSAHQPKIAPRGLPESYSGLTRSGPSEHLLVHDTKTPEDHRLSSFNENSGQVESVRIDWSRTDLPEDLEAVANVDGKDGEFLAVEGSQYNGRTPHLFLFNYADGQGQSLKRFDLPKLPYEIEGLVTKQRSDGDVLVLLGGRGDEKTQQGSLHWGIYDAEQQEMEWSSRGVKGVPVTMPEHLGPNERPIADLHLTEEGELLAAGCLDNGNYGPFESLVYRVGQVNANSNSAPVTLTLDRPTYVPGEKVEALDATTDGQRLLMGTDNESFGGTLQSLLRIS